MFAQGSECQMIKSKQIELRAKHAFHVKSGNMCGSKFGAYNKHGCPVQGSNDMIHSSDCTLC